MDLHSRRALMDSMSERYRRAAKRSNTSSISAPGWTLSLYRRSSDGSSNGSGRCATPGREKQNPRAYPTWRSPARSREHFPIPTSFRAADDSSTPLRLGKIIKWQDDTFYGKVLKWLDRVMSSAPDCQGRWPFGFLFNLGRSSVSRSGIRHAIFGRHSPDRA
jgi:hypothetical protein